MDRRNLTTALGLTAALTMLGVAVAPAADAGALKAKVYLIQRKVPSKGTEQALLQFARSSFTLRLTETNEPELKKRKWKAEMIVSFNQSIGDTEFQALFYDVHAGPRRFVDDMAVFVMQRNEKTFVQPVTLHRKEFKPNHYHELVITVRRAEVGKQKFAVVGQEEARSGTVDFSDSDR